MSLKKEEMTSQYPLRSNPPPIRSVLNGLPLSRNTRSIGNAFGDTVAGSASFSPLAAGAAAGALAAGAGLSTLNNSTGSTEPAATTADLIKMLKSGSSDSTGSSIEFLKGPLNAAVMGWLSSNAPMVDDLFKVTGLKPTDVIDKFVSAVRNLGNVSSVGAINDALTGVVETAKERVALKDDRYEFNAGYESKVNDVLGSREQWENQATGVATLQLIHENIPGGIRTVLLLREALEMEKPFFNELFTRTFGYDPDLYVGELIDNNQALARVSVR